VFWDLYSAHPDKREKAEASNEAKAYHKMASQAHSSVYCACIILQIFPPCGFPPEGLVNGGMYGPPGVSESEIFLKTLLLYNFGTKIPYKFAEFYAHFQFPNPNMGPMGVGPPPQPQNMPDGMFPGAYFNGPQRGGGPQPGPSQSNQASPIPGFLHFL
jgi:hypothetical protein